MSRTPLTLAQIEKALIGLSGWQYENHRLVKTFSFPNYRVAMSFVLRVAFAAEEINHHPELSNIYNRVSIGLTTHDAGNQVTEMDVLLARAIDSISWV